jgi:chromate transporter
MTTNTSAPRAPTFWEAFAYWFKLGFISFGGPARQIAIMHADLVERKRWISEQRYLHALNFCMMLPGPEAQQLATYIGWLMHRTWGGIMAGGLFLMPSLFILMGLSWMYMAYGDVPAIAGVLYGIKPAVTAIVLSAAYRIGSRALRNRWLWGIAVATFITVFAFNLPFPLILFAAGVIVNLAVFFAYHVLWPRGLAGSFEWASACIGVAAALALFRFKVGVIPVVLACGLAGLALTLLRPLVG